MASSPRTTLAPGATDAWQQASVLVCALLLMFAVLAKVVDRWRLKFLSANEIVGAGPRVNLARLNGRRPSPPSLHHACAPIFVTFSPRKLVELLIVFPSRRVTLELTKTSSISPRQFDAYRHGTCRERYCRSRASLHPLHRRTRAICARSRHPCRPTVAHQTDGTVPRRIDH